MDKIVVAFDGSDHSRRALERAAQLARGGAGVTVVAAVHVRPHAGRGPGPGPGPGLGLVSKIDEVLADLRPEDAGDRSLR